MRVITGMAKGRRLTSPSGDDVRPTTDVVKESVFSIIQFSVEGRRFLDAFAGSGQMGIEAVSRGAEKAVFLDSSRRSLAVVRENISLCGFGDRTEVHACDAVAFMTSTREKFDIVFLDPPYLTGLLERALEAAPRVTNDSGIIICEHPTGQELPEETGGFALKKRYHYGKICISIYSSKEVEGI